MVNIIGRGEHLALVNIIDLDGLQNLSLCKMADTTLCHDRDRDGLLDALDHLRVAHARHATSCTNVGRNALKSHNGTSTCSLSNLSLFRGCYIHDNTALKHLCKVAVESLSFFVHLLYFFFVLHCFPYVHAMCNKRRNRNVKRHFLRLYSLGVQPTTFLKNLVKWACDEKPNA